jgi:hypothetical protein
MLIRLGDQTWPLLDKVNLADRIAAEHELKVDSVKMTGSESLLAMTWISLRRAGIHMRADAIANSDDIDWIPDPADEAPAEAEAGPDPTEAPSKGA